MQILYLHLILVLPLSAIAYLLSGRRSFCLAYATQLLLTVFVLFGATKLLGICCVFFLHSCRRQPKEALLPAITLSAVLQMAYVVLSQLSRNRVQKLVVLLLDGYLVKLMGQAADAEGADTSTVLGLHAEDNF